MIDAKAVRKATGLTQPEFAARYRIPVSTVRQWEQHAREPTGAAAVLLMLIKRKPEAIANILREAS